MNFFRSLAEKSWVAQTAGVDLPIVSSQPEITQGKTALRFFIAVASVIFFLFTITFLSRTQFADFQALAGEVWQPFTDPTQLWLNTGVLLLAGIGIHWAFISAKQNNLNGAIIGLSFGMLTSLLFLIGQLYVWNHLISLGYFVTSNPANSFFYLLTCIHGLHLIGGIFGLIKITVKFVNHHSLEKLSTGLGLCKTYWHFLFLVWLLLFGLLTSTPETYKTIALLCGF